MTHSQSVKVAVIQRPPVLLDLKASMAAALASVEEAAGEGAKLLVFPETYLPGYPTWIWRLRPGNDGGLTGEIHARLRANAVDIDAGDLEPLCEAAAKHGVVIVMGLNELDSDFSGTTLFNSVVIIDADGWIANRHRKLMPTNPERMVWGQGDGSGLNVVETAVGRIGALICWENYMPLARFALYAQDIDIYVAPTWDTGESWIASMRHIAKEGGCWVIGTATAMEGKDVPADFPSRDELFTDDEWINDGDAVIVKPMGGVLAGPHTRDKSILYGDIDIEAARRARRSLDVAGHYGRPDLFKLDVNRKVLPPVSFED
ncbi:MAG: carbon-nitrogen hydrolase family protein [Alphaproteobacteria bacterium]|nr:MAG: carbon-nitrogen hydrolase family protein [Alphaproteobacteria bacterium]